MDIQDVGFGKFCDQIWPVCYIAFMDHKRQHTLAINWLVAERPSAGNGCTLVAEVSFAECFMHDEYSQESRKRSILCLLPAH